MPGNGDKFREYGRNGKIRRDVQREHYGKSA
jgi:hypothetical protein